jgi:hypothetical protein
MPYSYRKVRNKNCFKVFNKKTKKVFSKCTTRDKAQKQIRLLQAIENNKGFAKKVRNGRRTTRNNAPKNNSTRKIKKT